MVTAAAKLGQELPLAGSRTACSPTATARRLAWVSLACVGLALSGCSETYPAYPVVPALLTERVPVPPPADQAMSWRPGYYDFSDGNYIWRPGQWEPLAGHSTLWQDGYWVRSGIASYNWVPAGWK